ncbi:hypothetical protein KUTeg_000619 [Tegillarca granosa]|uniref:Uncharacterized protein n=1 Tax=Tegillarca granosa TaxID=220873 RepID=A0ABQ9FY10_TEGGR|nr:hypothetical protein KUTeg_000619 [Tegillarca granosa]
MADGMFLFWGSGSTPCMRVMMVLEEKGFSGYHQRQISFEKKENKCDEIIKLNPRGQVPTFTDKDGDIVINESQAICLYLEDTYKNQGVQLIPTDPQKKGFVLQRLCEVLLQERFQKARTELLIWDGYLEKEGEGRFICGDEFTMADVYLFTHLALCVRMGLDITKYRMLSEYYNRIKRRESVQKSWPPDWEDTPNLTFMTGI